MKNTIAAIGCVLAVGCASGTPEPERPPKPEPPLVEARYDLSNFRSEVQDDSGPLDQLAVAVIRDLLSRGHAEAVNGTVVVEASEEEQKVVAETLSLLRRRDEFTISVRTRFVEADWRLDGRSRLHANLMPKGKALELLKEPSVKTIQVPKISCFDAQRSSILTSSQFAYIRDYEVRFDRGGDWTADP